MKPVVDELERLSPAAAAELRAARRAAFDVSMRQSVMEYDAADLDRDRRLGFREFSRLVREREMAINTEEALRHSASTRSTRISRAVTNRCKKVDERNPHVQPLHSAL